MILMTFRHVPSVTFSLHERKEPGTGSALKSGDVPSELQKEHLHLLLDFLGVGLV